ncbi:hypothetical protein ACW9HL_15200 [Nocardia gipuzkoensis]
MAAIANERPDDRNAPDRLSGTEECDTVLLQRFTGRTPAAQGWLRGMLRSQETTTESQCALRPESFMRQRPEVAVMLRDKSTAGLNADYQRLLEVVELFPRGVQARRLAETLGRIPRDEFGSDITKRIRSLRSQLANLQRKGHITIEATAEYGNIYRPVNSPFDMSLWTRDHARANFANYREGRFGSDPVPVAAYSMMLTIWRNTIVEDVHPGDGLSRIHDGEMFAANVTVFRMIRDFLTTVGHSPAGRAEWDLLRHRLVDPNRIAAGTRTVADLLGEHYERWAEHASDTCAYYADLTAPADRDMEWFTTGNACFGAVQPNWFGLPYWPGVVQQFLAAAHDSALPLPAEQLRAGLLDGPDRMDPEILLWCVEAGIGYMRLRGH